MSSPAKQSAAEPWYPLEGMPGTSDVSAVLAAFAYADGFCNGEGVYVSLTGHLGEVASVLGLLSSTAIHALDADHGVWGDLAQGGLNAEWIDWMDSSTLGGVDGV